MSKVTDWGIGQNIIAMSDLCIEKVEEIDEGDYPELYFRTQQFRAFLGDYLDSLKSHDFGIYDTRCFKREFEDRLREEG